MSSPISKLTASLVNCSLSNTDKDTPLQSFLKGQNIDEYIGYLHSLLLGKEENSFCDLSPYEMLADFLLLFGCFVRTEESKYLHLMLYASPYCMEYLDTIFTYDLKIASQRPQQDFAHAVDVRISDFLDEDDPFEGSFEEGLNIMRTVAACPDINQKVLDIYAHALALYNKTSEPSANRMASLVQLFEKNTSKGFFSYLIKEIAQPAFLLNVFFAVCFPNRPRTDSFAWIELLPEQALELLVLVANADDIKRPLITYCLRKNASKKSVDLALQLIPGASQELIQSVAQKPTALPTLAKMASKNPESAARAFLQAVMKCERLPQKYLPKVLKYFLNAPFKSQMVAADFSSRLDEKQRKVLFDKLLKGGQKEIVLTQLRDEGKIYFVCYLLNEGSFYDTLTKSCFAKGIPLSDLSTLLDGMLIASKDVTEDKKNALKFLFSAHWTICRSTVDVFQPPEYAIDKKFKELAARYGIEKELVLDQCSERVQELFKDARNAIRRQKLSPSPSLLKQVLDGQVSKKNV